MKKEHVYTSTNPKTVCPDCKLKIKSAMAKRCMNCHIIHKNTGTTEYLPRSNEFRIKIKKKLKELAKEQGVSSDWLTALDILIIVNVGLAFIFFWLDHTTNSI